MQSGELKYAHLIPRLEDMSFTMRWSSVPLTFPGFGNPPGTPASRAMASAPPPAPPASAMLEPDIKKAKDALAKQNAARASTMLTGPGGLLGDPPLDRPAARSATVMGG